ncbi:MAG: hypothetical protein J5I93_05160 [Pirellulaceae bacterium]|nr:hypothetical protein [Pirellulaceae bacterium]
MSPEALSDAAGTYASELAARIEWSRVASFCVLTAAVWWIAGYLKRRHVLATGDARKLNHIVTLVGGALWFGWLPEQQARASMLLAAALLFALLVASGWFPGWGPLANVYLGYARESDGRQQRFHVWSAWLLGVYGLALIDGLCRDMVITRTAALILGIGDGLAEPVGRRFGRLKYPAPRLPGALPNWRTVEGSLTVFVGTWLVTCLAFGVQLPWGDLFWLSTCVAVLTVLAESLSPHGTDNFTIPVVAGLTIYYHPAYA